MAMEIFGPVMSGETITKNRRFGVSRRMLPLSRELVSVIPGFVRAQVISPDLGERGHMDRYSSR